MTAVYVTGAEWPVRCLGQPGGVRFWQSLETDPQMPAWRLVTDWCLQPQRVRRRHGLRVIGAGDVLAVCPELAGRLW